MFGASTGWLHALRQILPGLGADLPWTVLVVVHGSIDMGQQLCGVVAPHSPIPVHEAHDAAELGRGVYLAPMGKSIRIRQADDGRAVFALGGDPGPFSFAPSVDMAMASAARVFGSRVVAAVLSGLSVEKDGVVGTFAVKARGGVTIAQDIATARASGMPAAAIDAGNIDYVLPAAKIGTTIHGLVLSRATKTLGIPPARGG